MELNRRDLLKTVAVAAPLVLAVGEVHAATEEKAATPAPAAPAAAHVPVPLPFDPKKLTGISEKLIVSHHDNNYVAAVKGLNAVEGQLHNTKGDTPPFVIAGLRERELNFANSITLHELYFANLGGNGKSDGAVVAGIAEHFGSLARWEELFRQTGKSLGGGSGWVTLSHSHHSHSLRITWSGGHTQSLAFGQPLLVMDMYEHAYQMDFGAAADKYIDAFFQNIRWDEVNRRFEKAQAVAKLLKG